MKAPEGALRVPSRAGRVISAEWFLSGFPVAFRLVSDGFPHHAFFLFVVYEAVMIFGRLLYLYLSIYLTNRRAYRRFTVYGVDVKRGSF